MKRLCFMLCGLLASCVCSWGSADVYSVIQFPSIITLQETAGEIHINCSWNISNINLKVFWFKDQQKIHSHQNHKYTQIHSECSCAGLVIKHLHINDTGNYTCQVTQDIPRLITIRGAGTQVIYHNSHDNNNTNVNSMQTASTQTPNTDLGSGVGLVGSVSAIAFVLSVCLCVSVWWTKRRCTQSERVVIREGPPSEEGEQESSEDGGSTATSRGSTQWYMVPVYESYFDLQRSDDCVDDENAACAAALK